MARDARVLSATKVDVRVVSHKTRDYAAYHPREKTCKTRKRKRKSRIPLKFPRQSLSTETGARMVGIGNGGWDGGEGAGVMLIFYYTSIKKYLSISRLSFF